MTARSSKPSSGRIRLALAGTPRLLDNDGRAKALVPRDAALLAYLALEGPTSRSHLIGMLWPDADAEPARNALRQRIFQLNRRVDDGLVVGSELLALADAVVVDAVQGCDAELLQGGDHSEWPLFEQWLSQRRAAHTRAGREALTADADAAERVGRFADALQAADRLLALDPLHEQAHRRLMRLHYLNGDRAAAIAAFERCERALKDELGVKPGAETQALLETVERAAPAAQTRRHGVLPPAVQRPPRLIGRESELAAMRLAAASGRGVWLVGEAGMGKSRLLAEWAGERRNALVAQARPDDAATPYATLSRLLRAALQAVPGVLDDPLRAGLAGLLPELGAEPLPAARTPQRLRAATEQLVVAAAAAGVGTLIVDDLHFADEASIALIGGVLRPGLLAFAYAARPGEGSDAAAALREALLDERAIDVVTLSPLDERGLRQLIESLALPELDANALAPLLVRHSGGNLMFALETLKQMVLEGPSAGLPRPAHVGQLIERRLRRLAPRALSLARIAAVAGTDFSLALAEELLAASALELADAWEELEAAQIFRSGSFAHDLVHEAALRLVPQAVARTLHGRIAAHLEVKQAAIERIAYHWRCSLDAERAVPALRAAAQSALALFQRPAALVHLEQAVDFLLQLKRDREAFVVQLDVVSLLQGHDSGDRHEAAVVTLGRIAATPSETVRAGIALAILRHIQGRDAEAVAAIDGCAEQARAAGAHERAESLNVRGIALRGLGRIDEAIAVHREAIAIARADAREELPGCLNNLALALLEANGALEAAQAFDESARLQADVMTRARVLNNLGIAREESGQVEAALQARRDALGLLRGQDGAEFARANVLISMAGNARVLQRYREALALLDEADGIGLPTTHWRTSNLHCQRAALWIDLGVFDRADAAIELASQSAVNAGAQADVLIARAGFRQARGAVAADLLDHCDALLRDRGDRRTIRLARYRRALEGQARDRRDIAERELDVEASHGNLAAQVPFGVAFARALLDLGDVGAALAAARRAVETVRSAYPLFITPLAVRHVWWQTLHAAADAGAPPLIAELEEELMAIADRDVPPEFRHTFLRGVRLNRRLLSDAEAARGIPARVTRSTG